MPAGRSSTRGPRRRVESSAGFAARRLDVVDDRRHVLFRGIPGAHQTDTAFAYELIEAPTQLLKPVRTLWGDCDEDGVCFARIP